MTEVPTEAGNPIVAIRGLCAFYGDRRVLNDVHVDVRRGEIFVLLGGSGSGKTTLLKQVLGLGKPQAGHIVINGVDITSCPAAQLAAVRRRIGVAFQASALFNSLSVYDNVALPLQELTRLAAPIIDLIVWMKLEAVGLGDAAKLMPHQLSGGMRKRAAIARAMALDPDILVFDEPSAGLDPVIAAEIDQLILLLKRAFGITMLVVTHAIESALRIGDRLAMLHQGGLIAVGSKEQFLANTNPRVRQFLDRQPEAGSREAAEFAASFLRRMEHEH
jgi:phospholipid/cholesterol/gamma-HCH transport system ATP-binding protein